jgi:carboxyl-terminal processing protease
MNLKNLSKWAGAGLVALTILAATYITFFRSGRNGLQIDGTSGSAKEADEIPIPEEMKALTDLYRVINLVQRRYIDASRINPREMFIGAMRSIQMSISKAMVSESKDILTLKMGSASENVSLREITTPWVMLQRIKDVFSFIKKEAADDFDMQAVEYDAINGMLQTLDPHSIFLNPDQYREMQDKTQGKFAGLGVVISIRDGALTIVSPMDGTPADAAGILAGDQITQIDGESTVNMPLNDAVDLLRGEPGTSVTVHVLRKGWPEPKMFRIIRAEVKVESLETHFLAGRVGYVRIKDFQGNTAADVAAALREWGKKGIKGLVLDLRGCPGGLLDAAVEVSDLFLKEGVIVTTAGQDPNEREVRRAENTGDEPDYPIVTIIDQGSASASEILAGALKNHNRSLVIGERSFGKGSVQVLFEFHEDNLPNTTTALKLTTAQYLTPGDISIQSVGVVPHVEVQPIRADEEMIDLTADEGYHESDLNHHFETAGEATKNSRSPSSLSYLWVPPKNSKPPKAEGEAESEVEEEPLPDKNKPFEPDFVASFAEEMVPSMESLKGKDLSSSIVYLAELISNKQQDEEKRLTAALKKLGIDWQPPKHAESDATADASITLQINDDKPLQAGKEVALVMSVSNKGPGTLYRLSAVSQSDFRPLNERELAFGRVGPKETVTRTLSFHVPKDAPAEVDDVRWSFSAEGTSPPAPYAMRFNVVPIQRPHFAYQWRIDDTKNGNGDGKVQVGEPVELVCEVKNIGKGSSIETYATLKSLGGKDVFLTRGREVLKSVDGNAVKEARFAFSVKNGFKEKEARFELAVADVILREFLIEKLTISVDAASSSATAKPGNGGELSKINSAPTFEIEEPVHVTKSDQIRIHGRALDESKVRDVYIFVGNEKKFFAENLDKKNPGSLSFEAELPLKPGINYITLVAEENADLEMREVIAIRRDREDSMPFVLSRTSADESIPLGVFPANISTFSPVVTSQIVEK